MDCTTHGTQSDPFAGGTIQATGISITGLTNPDGKTPREAVATTATDHGYINGDVITISGVSGSGAAQWNGTFAIYGIDTAKPKEFKYYMLATPTASPVLGGGVNASKVIYLFDEVMRSIPAKTAIHIGPGVFETRGYSSQAPQSIQVKSGQRILGSGIDVTVVKLVYATSDTQETLAFGHDWSDTAFLFGFEASGFTVDCNLAGQKPLPKPALPTPDFARVCCGAIVLRGQHVRIHGVKAIGFGTQTWIGDQSAAIECFVIVTAGSLPSASQAEAVDCVIEDCIIERPSPNNSYTCTCSVLAASEDGKGILGYHRGCVIRNCFIDCEFGDDPVPIESITYSSPPVMGKVTVTITTRVPHNRVLDQWVVISGALVNGSPINPFNGSFRITSANSTQFTYETAAPSATPSGDMWVNKWPSSQVGVSNDPTSITLYSAGDTYKIKTATPHNRRPGDVVTVRGVIVDVDFENNPYNGAFTVRDVLSPTELTYTLRSTPDPTKPIVWSSSKGIFLGSSYVGISADAGTGAVVEGNRVRNCLIGFYHDTFSTKDLVIRNNHFYRVNDGIVQTLDGFSFSNYLNKTPYPWTTLIHSGTTAILTAVNEHGFTVSQGVRIRDAKRNGILIPEFNGLFVVTSILDSRTFTYEMLAVPVNDADPSSGLAGYSGKWQVRRWAIEHNIIELIWNIHPLQTAQPTGIYLVAADLDPIYTFWQTLIRGNIIRSADNAVDPSGAQVGIQLTDCETAIVEGNIIDVPNYRLLFYNRDKLVQFFDNNDSAGNLLRGQNDSTKQKADELATRLEDAMVMSL